MKDFTPYNDLMKEIELRISSWSDEQLNDIYWLCYGDPYNGLFEAKLNAEWHRRREKAKEEIDIIN